MEEDFDDKNKLTKPSNLAVIPDYVAPLATEEEISVSSPEKEDSNKIIIDKKDSKSKEAEVDDEFQVLVYFWSSFLEM